MKKWLFIVFAVFQTSLWGQNTFNFDGQLSGVANWAPEADAWGLLNVRYLPELNYDWKLNDKNSWYFEASANVWGSSYFYNDSTTVDGNVSPYRIWTRFSGKRYEVRLGLQKIDFGSAMILRPLQWFNEIDPRDPLAITDGVNALLGRYYFKNNANIWLWGLYGNEDPRGFDIAQTYQKHPEFGGRFQHPVPKGELAVSYHHRTSDLTNLFPLPELQQIPENRIGLDGKWDVGIGLWFETAYIKKEKELGEQFLGTLGMDYTFPLGSGLNVVVEHMYVEYALDGAGLNVKSNTSALNIAYPIGFFDNLSLFMTYSWEVEAASFFLNYQHDFKRVTTYLMAFYTPSTSLNFGNEDTDFVSNFTGPGLRLMVLWKH
ncbi:MAG: hypothetical protein N4A46_04750 [Schleiferiaceae bacterium]|jgi:hypothetical protein|nr:hypothetical protein [Schleiferiaceae bacterium]